MTQSSHTWDKTQTEEDTGLPACQTHPILCRPIPRLSPVLIPPILALGSLVPLLLHLFLLCAHHRSKIVGQLTIPVPPVGSKCLRYFSHFPAPRLQPIEQADTEDQAFPDYPAQVV